MSFIRVMKGMFFLQKLANQQVIWEDSIFHFHIVQTASDAKEPSPCIVYRLLK